MTTIVDRVKVTTGTLGTGTITLGVASPGYQTFAQAGVADGATVRYVIEDGVQWEIGTGTYHSGTQTMDRSLLHSSTGSLLSLDGQAVVYIAYTADSIANGDGITKTNGVAFAAVATSGSASDLSTGTLPDARLSTEAYAAHFGTGSDGNLTISSGVTSLTRDGCYNNLTISGTGQLNLGGCRLFVAGTLDISAAPANAIVNTAGTAGNASGSTGGAVGLFWRPLLSATVGGQATSGANGGTAAGSTAASPAALVRGLGGDAGNGGAGGTSGANAGGNPGTAQSLAGRTQFPSPFASYLATGGGQPGGGLVSACAGCAGSGGGGGGGDGTNAGGGGGAGGCGGSSVEIYARTINRGASTAAGAISAKGITGGNGANGTGGNAAGGGGGGGAGGGYARVVAGALTGTTATGAIDVSGGNGGNGGTGSGTGGSGAGGTAGKSGLAELIVLTTSSYTSAAVNTAPATAPSGVTGGTAATVQLSI